MTTGTSGNDRLQGGSGDDVLEGLAGDDVLIGGAGIDRTDGGAGNDRHYVDSSADVVIERAGEGIDTVFALASYVLPDFVENLVLDGTAAINGTGNALANTITGNAAANRIDGGAGADKMKGGDGNDSYVVDNAGDQVVEVSAAGGLDRVSSSVSFALGAYVENLTLSGSAAIDGTGNGLDNILSGNAAANVLNGAVGADTMKGADGNDTYIVDNVGDRAIEVSATGGTDTVRSAVSFTLGGYVENLTLTGAAAINGTGNGLANTIVGNGAGNVLNGGAGSDVLTGGAGADRFAFTAALGAGNVDSISDFTPGSDKIVLGGAAGEPFRGLATGSLASGAFAAGTAAADADDRILYDSATGALFYDADGVGGAAAVKFAAVGSGLALSAASFEVSGPANTLPVITSAATASVQENVATSTIVYQAAAQDADGDRIVYSLSGSDAASFTIDQSGAVRFVSSPDYEVKSSYSFIVKAVDSSGTGDTQTVALSVTDVAETKPAYLVAETAAANDSTATAQQLDRTRFAPTSDTNFTDPSLPSAKITGKIATGGDQDFFSVTLKAGELLVLDVDGTTTLDSYVKVFGPDGLEIAANDDQVEFDAGSNVHSGVSHNMDSLIRVRAPEDGTYTFSISSFVDPDTGQASSSGGYTLNVSIGPTATADQINEENVESLLSGSSWSTLNLTYGFTTSPGDYESGVGVDEIKAGMRGLNLTQQAAVKTILAEYANVTNLTFAQVTTNPGSAQLRYALSGYPDTAHAYYPGPGEGGDSWYNTTGYTSPKIGNYEWTTFIHETGHALGLKHGHESPALSPDRDSLEYSVMTYRSYIGASVDDGSGYTNETWGFPQTLMMYDIGALQKLYGADFTFHAGDTTYGWNPTTGAFLIDGATQWTPGGNRVFMTIWDGGGTDTYDLSNYNTAVKIDLRPGEWTRTSVVQLADLGDFHFARGNVANALLYNHDPRSLIENAIGGSGNDDLIANQATNHLTGGAGADTFQWFSPGDSAAGSRADTITDFSSKDILDFSGIDAVAGTDRNEAFTLIHGNAFSGTAGELRFETVGNSVHMFGDVNGDAVADFQVIATFPTGTPAILDSQFVL